MRAERHLTANESLLDRQLFDVDGRPAGKVDDLELSADFQGGPPVLTALLTGPTAFGPRLGGRLGVFWLSVGRRLRPNNDPYPNRVPITQVEQVDGTGVRLNATRDRMDLDRFRDWVRDHIIGRIPGATGRDQGGSSSDAPGDGDDRGSGGDR